MARYGKNPARSSKTVAYARLRYSDLPTGVETKVVELPGGALLHSVRTIVVTPSNAATTDVLDVGLDSGAANVFQNDTNAKAVAGTRVAAAESTLGVQTVQDDYITVTRTENGVATAGEWLVVVEYSEEHREQFTQG